MKKSYRKNSKRNNNKENNKYYYLIFTKNLVENRIKKFFEEKGNWEKYNLEKPQKNNPDFIYIDSVSSYESTKFLWKYKSYIKNTVDGFDNISHKDRVYQEIYKYLKKNPNSSLQNYALKQYKVDLRDSWLNKKLNNFFTKTKKIFKNNDVWIFKPVSGWSGMMIEAFDDYDDFKEYCYKIIDKYSPVWKNKKLANRPIQNMNDWVIQEYILYPHLFEERKYHIRPYILYHKNKKTKMNEAYLFDKMIIFTAKDKYKPSDFHNKDIHDTHMKSTPERMYFPDALLSRKMINKRDVKNIRSQIKDLFTYLIDMTKTNCYPESDNCFQIIGADIILDKNLVCKLIEVQITNLGYGIFKNDEEDIFHKIFFNCVDLVVDNYIPPLNSKNSKKYKDFELFYSKPF